MRGVRFVRWMVVMALCASLAVAVFESWRNPDAASVSGYVQTPSGPLGPADRDVLVRVKLAGLWEMPAADELSRRGDGRAREIGRNISDEHYRLNQITDDAAKSLGVELQPSATVEQEDWVSQVKAASNADIGAVAVNILRQAHGKVLPLLVSVRTGTRNDAVRKFTETAMTFVQRHIGYLESTGLVDYAALPEPPAPVPLVSPIRAAYYAAVDRPTLAFSAATIAGIVVLGLYIATRLSRRKPLKTGRHSHRRRK